VNLAHTRCLAVVAVVSWVTGVPACAEYHPPTPNPDSAVDAEDAKTTPEVEAVDTDAGKDDGIALDSDANDSEGVDACTAGSCAAACTPSGCADAVELAMGSYHVCARLSDGSVWCWGDNTYGRLGDGTIDTRVNPKRVTLEAAIGITAGESHTCALLRDQTVKCWGANGFGEVGDGTNETRLTPTPVKGLAKVDQIAAGAAHTCARMGGTVKCWGNNVFDQLGDGSTLNKSTPVQVSGMSDAVTIAMGGYHGCAIRPSKTLYCWGDNDAGALGDGSVVRRKTPNLVPGSSGTEAVFAGSTLTCALTSTSASCWGGGQKTPVPDSSIIGARHVALDITLRCMIDSAGAPYCWGTNSSGQVGDGTLEKRDTPTALRGLATASAIAVAGTWACAISNGAVYCWGSTPFGIKSSTPQVIAW
jgi:alpha-tubulin suppressor-like RCC1 family protein